MRKVNIITDKDYSKDFIEFTSTMFTRKVIYPLSMQK